MVQQGADALDLAFQALAHPARRDMLHRLCDGERNLSDLAAPLRMSFVAASKHVRVLERAGIVSRRVSGRNHFCRIEAKPLQEASGWLERHRAVWEANFSRLDAVLEGLGGEPARDTLTHPSNTHE